MKNQAKQFLSNYPRQPHYYGNAAHAFYDVMIWIQQNQPKSKPNIIMPVYIPAKLYRFILAAGYKPRFYDVSTELDFSIDEILNLIDDQTQMIFAVHYFGIPVDLHPLKDLAQKQGIFLLEDCAHTLNGSWKGRILGTTGDFAIFSIRKMLQLHCGGFLILNNQPWHFQPSASKRVCSLFTGYHFFGSRVKFMLNRLSRGRNLLQKISIPETAYIDFSEEQTVNIKQMDFLSRMYFLNINLKKVIKIRRENVRYLWNHIHDLQSFTPIGFDRISEVDNSTRSSAHQKYQPTEGYVPFSLPLLTPPGTRELIQQEMLKHGIVCYIGWTEAPFGMKNFPQTDQLQSRLLELPVHQYINQHQLKTMVTCLNNLELHSTS